MKNKLKVKKNKKNELIFSYKSIFVKYRYGNRLTISAYYKKNKIPYKYNY